jgi:hypothetical protein
MFSQVALEVVAFVLFGALLTSMVCTSFVLFLTMIFQYSSFKSRMKPLNEAGKEQREKEREKRKDEIIEHGRFDCALCIFTKQSDLPYFL